MKSFFEGFKGNFLLKNCVFVCVWGHKNVCWLKKSLRTIIYRVTKVSERDTLFLLLCTKVSERDTLQYLFSISSKKKRGDFL